LRLLHVCCLRIQQLARKFEADLTFDFGTVIRQGRKPASDAAVGHAGNGGRWSQLRRCLCQFPIPPVEAGGGVFKIKPFLNTNLNAKLGAVAVAPLVRKRIGGAQLVARREKEEGSERKYVVAMLLIFALGVFFCFFLFYPPFISIG